MANGYNGSLSYTYDDNGNILSVSDGTYTTTYVYDTANQLIRENNQAAGKTWTWTYDGAGNIQNRKEYAYTTGTLGAVQQQVNYLYENSTWGDLLTSYNGAAITSDAIGNMLSDGTWNYTWQHGRELASMTDGSTTWSFTYNADGMRTGRSNGSTTYKYFYVDGKLSHMLMGSSYAHFAYDIDGAPIWMRYNGSRYYYVTNLQGDVIAILDTNGNSVVQYTYDAWGKVLSITGTMADTIGTMNPLLYRSYIYDHDTGLYYLQTRYYNPTIGRFICADDPAYLGMGNSLVSYNIFAYCGNNPVIGYDPTGHWDWGGVIAGLGIIAGTIITVATFGVGSPVGVLVAGAAITTGAVTTYAAATDSTMVVDLSYSYQVTSNSYAKFGVSLAIDFNNDESNLYFHGGGGYGRSSGVSYSTGIISNYEDPQDYAGHFTDVSVGYNVGIDHCWTPQDGIVHSTQATSITFSSGLSFGVGYDYYLDPILVCAW